MIYTILYFVVFQIKTVFIEDYRQLISPYE